MKLILLVKKLSINVIEHKIGNFNLSFGEVQWDHRSNPPVPSHRVVEKSSDFDSARSPMPLVHLFPA